MQHPTPELVEDALETNEIFLDALYSCFEKEINPQILYTQALHTVLLAMFESAHDKKTAAEAAAVCLTTALMASDDQEQVH